MMPAIHISRPGVSDEETDRQINQGFAQGIFRQCSIGYHNECSDPDGAVCRCTCHTEGTEKESIVCPHCGMSTWYQGTCAACGCEGRQGGDHAEAEFSGP